MFFFYIFNRVCSFVVGNGAIQTTLGASPCRRSVFWDYYPKPVENLGFKACTGTFLGLSFATSFLAAEQGAVQFDNGVYDGFHGSKFKVFPAYLAYVLTPKVPRSSKWAS